MARPAVLTRKVEVITTDGQREKMETSKAIVSGIELGMPRRLAAQAAGVGERTLQTWLAKGREVMGMAESQLSESQKAYRQFAQDVEKADGLAVRVNLQRIEQAARQGNWTASAWVLERRHPSEFSRRVEVKTDPEDREPAPVDMPTAEEVAEAFSAAHVPEGIEVSSVLPELGGE